MGWLCRPELPEFSTLTPPAYGADEIDKHTAEKKRRNIHSFDAKQLCFFIFMAIQNRPGLNRQDQINPYP